ncbi:hypothetical protein D3C84_1096520 [compost metagenome]
MGVSEHHRRRGQAPGDHDPADPGRRPVAFETQAAGHFEQDVANEEHARGQTIRRVGQAQFMLHLGLGEADVDPVKIGE